MRLGGVLVFLLAGAALAGEDRITTTEAKEHVGETRVYTVTGIVRGTRLPEKNPSGTVLLLDLDGVHPDQVCTVQVLDASGMAGCRSAPEAPTDKVITSPVTYQDKVIAVTGKITEENGVVVITVRTRCQIFVIEKP